MTASEDSSGNPAAPASSRAVPGAQETAEAVNPGALSIAQLARMLGVPAEKVQEHVDAGAPTGSGGTVNLVQYAAWLNRELVRTDGD